MAKPIKLLLILLALLVILGAGYWFLMSTPQEPGQPDGQPILLADRSPDEVKAVEVHNQNGGYTFYREAEGYVLHDLPPEKVNPEYVAMLLDEASRVECLSEVTDELNRLSDFGLETPEAEVNVIYADGGAFRLLLGAEETVSGGRYCMELGGDRIYLMKNNRTIRFTMPVEKYLSFIIIPPEESTSVLSVLQDIRFSGTSLPAPIALTAVLPERKDTQVQALSYGAVTHIVTEPGIHEADPGALLQIADDLLGLISEGIVAYNCTDEALASYGFAEPWLQIDFDYKNGKDAPVVPYTLRVAETDEGYIATVNDEGIVYRILDLSFLHVTYEDLVLRWFLSPFLTDVSALELSGNFGAVRFELAGENSKDIAVTLDGATVDSEMFRRFYNLVVSAASDGAVSAEAQSPGTAADLTIRYTYRDGDKADDVLELFRTPQRRLLVSVNGACEFTMRENYLAVVTKALTALNTGESFTMDW